MELGNYTTELAEIIVEVESNANAAEIALARAQGEIAALRDDIDVLLGELGPWDETARQQAEAITRATSTALEARLKLYALIDAEYAQLCAIEAAVRHRTRAVIGRRWISTFGRPR